MRKIKTGNILFSLCLLIFAVLAIRNFREPDLWWILRTGEWIFTNRSVPLFDTFSYTMQNTPWLNVKWLYELIAYGIQAVGGVEFVPVIQLIVNVLILIYLYRLYCIFSPIRKISEIKPGWVLAVLLAAVASEFRMTGRPEMFSYLFSLMFVYYLLRYKQNPGKLILAIFVIQVVWTNMHEAFGMGLVLTIAYAVSVWFDRMVLKSAQTEPLKRTAYMSILPVLVSLAAICINPRGLVLLAQPLEIFRQLQLNKFTSELLPMYKVFNDYPKEIIITFIMLLGSLPAIFYRLKKSELTILQLLVSSFGSFTLAVFVMFLYLAITAVRNVPYFVYIAVPFFVISADRLFNRNIKEKAGRALLINYVMIGLSAVLYISIVSNLFYKAFDKREKYGLQISTGMHPIAAAEFIEQKHIKGRCFSDFLISSGLMWQLRPDFKTFIDLRDLDVFPAEFFNEFIHIVSVPLVFERADSIFHFDYIVLFRSNYFGLQQYLYNNPKWQFVYCDAVSLIFIKKTGLNRDIMAKIDTTKNCFREINGIKASVPARFVSYLFNPFYNPDKDKVFDNNLVAADLYSNLGDVRVALNFCRRSIKENGKNTENSIKMADLYFASARDSSAMIYMDSARLLYKQVLKKHPNEYAACKGLAMIEYYNRNWKMSEKLLLKAVRNADNDVNLYLMLASIQTELNKQSGGSKKEIIEKWEKYMLKAYHIDPGNNVVRLNLGFYYSDIDNCRKAEKYLKNLESFPGMNQTDRQKLKDAKIRCGIE